MAVPSLVIGLGGTGQWVLTYLKKTLLETYGEIPREVRIRAFDTVRIARAQAGGQSRDEGQQRVEERAVAGVHLEPGEYIHTGGYVKPFVEKIAQDEEGIEYSHLRSWFQAKVYLEDLKLPDNQYFLDEGAGQFRQFGRLAVFHDLQAATVSRIYGQLQDTVQEIQRLTNTRNLQVFVIGSLAGGTGAGMFVDMAHLVRQIAKEQAKIEVKVRGFLVLPDAFGALPASSVVKRGMNARAFAAMRENKRFTVNFDWALGYPMYYKAEAQVLQPDPVLQSAIKGQLFDQLYYVDGHRENFPLFSIPLENGVAPSIADMVAAILDDQSSGAFEEHTKNLQAVISGRGGARTIPYYGALGTYSVVFPIYHVIQGYAHQLGLEVLENLLTPSEKDPRTGVPTKLAGDRNVEAGEGYTGANAARAFLTSSSIVDPTDPTRAIDNTLLTNELVYVAERFSPQDASIVDNLASRSLEEWDRIFSPTGQSEDVLQARARAEGVLRVRLVDEVPPSKDVKPQEKPSDGMYRIENGVRSHKNVYLGTEQPETGQRIGGKYREALGEFSKVHVNRFQRMLEYKTQEILNGRSAADPLLAKGGKLGHLQDFLRSLTFYLDRSYQVMTRVMDRRRSQDYGRMQAIAAAQNALNDMKAHAGDTRPIVGKAHKTQAEYLEREQSLIDIHKVEIMEQAVADAIKQLSELVASAQASVDAWVQTLATSQDGLYASLLAGSRQVDANRDKDADVESRLTLGARKAGRGEDEDYRRFKKYEKERYQRYVYEGQANQVAEVLRDLNWQIAIESRRGKPVFTLGLTVTTHGEGSSTNRMADGANQDNNRAFLSRSQEAFAEVKRNESVLDYLMYAYGSAEALAETIHRRSGPLLSENAEGPIPANYLRVWHGDKSAQADYLRTVLRRLASLSSITDVDKYARLVASQDRFTLTLVHTRDLIELDRMSAYINGRSEYLGYRGEAGAQTSRRSILHCFPAEVNAVQLEERLIELQQAVRMLDDEVVLQLEKPESMRRFLMCYAYGLVDYFSFEEEGGQSKETLQLSWEPIDERDSGEVWLTRPKADTEPRFLDALLTFSYVGQDVGHGDTYHKSINYAAVWETLEQRQREDLEKRRNAGTLGNANPAMKEWLATQQVPESDQLWLLLARYDRLYEMERRFTGLLPDLARQIKDSATGQEDYDLMSVFVLILRDELEKLSRRIRGRAPRESRSSVEQGKQRTAKKKESPWRL